MGHSVTKKQERITMKLASAALIVIAVVVLLGAGYYFGQRQSDTAQVKLVLADMTVHANELERRELQVKSGLANLALELHGLKLDAVDKVLRKYGM